MKLRRLLPLSATALALAVLPACLDGDSTFTTTCGRVNIPALDADTVTLASGVRYIVAQPGTGEAAEASDSVFVEYNGFLTDGTLFDSGRFGLELADTRYIEGFRTGILGMQTNEVRRVIIPPSLGYGTQDLPCIPPNSTLLFDIKLLQIGTAVAQ